MKPNRRQYASISSSIRDRRLRDRPVGVKQIEQRIYWELDALAFLPDIDASEEEPDWPMITINWG